MDSHNKKLLIAIGAIIAVAMMVMIIIALTLRTVFNSMKPNISLTDQTEVYMTPTQIESIRNIGQWEFMSINDEELVDTTRKGLFFDDHLVRIYYGTLRLGLDLSTITSDDFLSQGDTLTICLPQVTLLDEDFIDEARTKSFHETGSWTGSDRRALYERAQEKMKKRCLTPEAYEQTRKLAEAQLRQMLLAMGFEHVNLRFE